MNVDSGRVIPRVDCTRFCTSSTALSDIVTATSVSGSGAIAFAAEVWLGGEDSAFLGGAIVTLLRSRCASFDIRADWSDAYEDEMFPV